ncbi:hypothetical protein [Nocardioides sp. AE5]|uniref:hypothetical protein n=1 Tax=Nocardioides sp. AE5 TaxID=2962573 RepID=UPI0028822A05|nr:hypothetical protein [Nocardioides sp. AE5]MDT0201250.1 hypothetical protein [Nocardioides sp. AE5]
MSSPLPLSRVRVQRIAESAVERARLSVVPRLDPHAPRVPFVTLVSLLLVAGVVGLLLFNTTMQQNAFANTALEKQARELSDRQQGLQMELDELRNPQRVAEKAQELGMVPSLNPAFINLSDGTILGNPVPAKAEDGIDVRPPEAKKPAELDPAPLVIKVPAQPEASADTDPASPDRDAAAGSNDSSSNDRGDRSSQ